MLSHALFVSLTAYPYINLFAANNRYTCNSPYMKNTLKFLFYYASLIFVQGHYIVKALMSHCNIFTHRVWEIDNIPLRNGRQQRAVA